MSNIPFEYDYINACNSAVTPSTVHVRDVGLTQFFRRYLVQDALSVFKITLPDTWGYDYFRYCLFLAGSVGVVNTDKFGVIAQCGTPYGYNVYYEPTHYVISNPLISNTIKPKIGIDCEVIKLQPDYGGIYDLISYYADLMSLTSQSIGVNLLNSKLAYVLTANNKATAESLKKLYDRVASGEPAVVIDKMMYDDNGNPSWSQFDRDLKSSYIVDDLISDLRKIRDEFHTAIGIPNANTDKRERLISDEVNANNVSTRAKVKIWFDEISRGMQRVRDMFGITASELSIEWSEDIEING